MTIINSSTIFSPEDSDSKTLYPFQESVYDLLTKGRSVICRHLLVRAKRGAALYPFLWAWEQNA